MSYRIGVDIMGSDRSPKVLLDAVLQQATLQDASTSSSANTISLFGSTELASYFAEQVAAKPFLTDHIEFIAAGTPVLMTDAPLAAVRLKKDSSLLQGVQALAQGSIQAFISAGNTGAFMLASSLHLPLIPPLEKPALAAVFPVPKSPCLLLDIGGNVSCRSLDLLHFALLGKAFISAFATGKIARIGLLNIGSEAKKGTALHQEAFNQLAKASTEYGFEFVGNVEPGQVYQGAADVVVADGFSGNIFLKTAESSFTHLSQFFKEGLATANIDPAILQLALAQMKLPLTLSQTPGALLLGFEKLLIKCHGRGDPASLIASIQLAEDLLSQDFISSIRSALT